MSQNGKLDDLPDEAGAVEYRRAWASCERVTSDDGGWRKAGEERAYGGASRERSTDEGHGGAESKANTNDDLTSVSRPP